LKSLKIIQKIFLIICLTRPRWLRLKRFIDLKSGGKLGDVRNKLANLINPKETSANHPLKKFIELKDASKGHLEQINKLKSERAKLQLRLDRESVSPEQQLSVVV
jgi:hypothetical protein